MGRRHWELVWCLCWASIGCNGGRAIAPGGDDQAVVRVRSAIIGGDSHDVTALQTVPARLKNP
jgi:hypothetical protein